jgi:NAD(P)-dependent dehydrogenase (short-subunit alcohol dehydrogenase family)
LVAAVVSISSAAGRVARARAGVYAVTKSGISAFSEALRQELIPQQNRVVGPGTVNTELVSQVREDTRRAAQRGARLTEPPRPEDIGDVLVYLVTRSRRVAANEALIRAAKQTGSHVVINVSLRPGGLRSGPPRQRCGSRRSRAQNTDDEHLVLEQVSGGTR